MIFFFAFFFLQNTMLLYWLINFYEVNPRRVVQASLLMLSKFKRIDFYPLPPEMISGGGGLEVN